MSGCLRNPRFNVSGFLQESWQRQPLLLRDFLPGFKDPLDPDELAGLACEAAVESRLVRRQGDQDYRLQHGPFSPKHFRQLPDQDWTLLVQAVDQWLEPVRQLKQAFDFLPSWRIDDVMVSFATAGGGVGPHLDYYDVFLIQGQGRRRWQLADLAPAAVAQRDQDGVMLLEQFEPTQELELAAGDVLYIPPGFPHWGTALSDSLCYSIGFRAPSLAEMLEGFSEELAGACQPMQRFRDSQLQQAARAGEITAAGLELPFQELTGVLSCKSAFQRWFGRFVTEPRYPELVTPPPNPGSVAQLTRASSRQITLTRNPASRFAFMAADAGDSVWCFVDGDCHPLPAASLELVAWLCGERPLDRDFLLQARRQPELAALLDNLLEQGSILH